MTIIGESLKELAIIGEWTKRNKKSPRKPQKTPQKTVRKLHKTPRKPQKTP